MVFFNSAPYTNYPASSGGGASSLATLSDVAITSPTNGQILVYNSGTGKWVNSTVGGTGTVTSVSVATLNGVSGTVLNATTTPSIRLTLGAITPSSVASTGTVTGTNLSGTNTGDETTATIKTKLGAATTSLDGYLTSTDWNTFNNKQAAGSYITNLTGDVTASGPGSVAATIANDAVTYAKFQNASTNNIILGRATAGSGNYEEITLGTGLSLTGTTLSIVESNYPQVNTYNDLPITIGTPAVGAIYVVLNASGVWLINRKESGLYRRTGNTGASTDWERLGNWSDIAKDGNFQLVNSTDTNKLGRFDLSGVTSGQNRVLTWPNKNGTIACLSDITGDVVGPGTSVTNNVVFFDGITGKLIKDSGLTLSGTNTGDQTITLTGNVTGSGTGSFVTTIANSAVTYAKIQNVTAQTLLGRYSASSGVTQEITIGSGLSLDAGTGILSSTGGGGSGTVTSVSVVTANGVSGSVATATTTPAITLTLGAITPSSVAASGTVTGSNLSGTNTGDVTIGTANGLSLAGQALSLATSSTSTTGALTSADWNTFNNKGDMLLGTSQTVTSSKTFNNNTLILAGATSGNTTLIATAIAGTGTVTLPTSGTLYGTATGSITSAQLATSVSDETGSGALVFATSPTLVTPNIGAASGTSLAVTGSLTSGTASTTAGTLVLQNATNAFTQTIRGTNPSANIIYDLPTTAPTTDQVLKASAPSGGIVTLAWTTPTTGSGTVTSASVVTANGFAGSVATATTTPAITLTTTVTGLLKGNGTAISAATAGTDYENPLTFSTGLTRTVNTVTVNTSQNISTLSNLTSNGFVKTSGGTGALSIDTNTYLTSVTLSGDVTGSGSGSITTTIANSAVTYAKIQNVTTQTLLGRYAATNGVTQEITIGSGLTLDTGTGVLSAVTGGGGTVTSVSVVTANGVSGSVATATTTPAITLTLGAITPSSVAASGTVTGSNLSGTNTGDVTIGTANGLSLAGQALSLAAATTSTTGALTSTDWNTFNNKGDMLLGTSQTVTSSKTFNNNTLILAGATSGTTTLIATAIAGSGTVTLPTSGTLYGTATGSITSSQLATSVSDETGSGALVFATSPTLITPTLGVASATTINKLAITAPATGSTLTILDGKTLTSNNTLTFSGTDGSTLNIGAGGTLGSAAYTSSSAYEVPLTFSTGLTRTVNTITVNTSQNISTLSNLTSNGSVQTSGGTGALSVIANTGTGNNVLATSPTLVTPTLGVATATTVNKLTITAPATGSTLTILDGKTLTVNNTLTFSGTDSSTLNIGAGGTLGSAAFTSSSAYEVPLTFSTGLTRTVNTVTVNTSQNISTLSNLTSNGSVQTSGGTGALSVIANTGTGNNVLATSPTLTTPNIGVASGTSLSVTGSLTSGVASTTAGTLVLQNATNAFTQTIRGTNPSASIIYDLPTTAPTAGQILSSSAPSGGVSTLSWISVGGGGTVTSVDVSGGTTGLTFSGGAITGSGTITMAGTLGVLNGGTGTTTSTGSGSVVLATSPTLVTPTLGVASATTVNKVTITAPATSATLTILNGKTLTSNNTLTFSGTDGSTLNIGAGGTLGTAAYTAASAYEVPLTFSTGLTRTVNTVTVNTSQNISTLSNLTSNGIVTTSGGTGALSVTATTGSGSVVLATSPTLVTPALGVATATTVNKVTITAPTTGSTLTIADGKTLTASNTLTFAGTDSSTLNIGTGGTLGTAAYTAASAYEVPLTFSTGLTRTVNTVTVNTSQNISTLSNLTSNGFVKTTGGTGALSIDTTTYLSTVALTGDVTGSGTSSIATTIANSAVTYAKIQNVTSQTLLGRFAGTNGVTQEITIGSGLTLNSGTGVLSASGGGSGTVTSVSVVTANGVSGSVATATTTPAITLTLGDITPNTVTSAGDIGNITGNIVSLTGDIVAPAGSISAGVNISATGTVTGSNLSGTNTGDQTITLTSDVTGTGTGSFATTIAANAVTFAKFQQLGANTVVVNNTASTANATTQALSANQLLGRGSSGNIAPITIGSGLSFNGTALSAQGINYLTNFNAEVDTTGWATYADAAGSIPIDGTGGTATGLTFSRNTTTPLRGTGDFSFAKDAANRQGLGVSYDFTLNNVDTNTRQTISFDYSTTTNYVTGDLVVYVYDITNAVQIQPSSFQIEKTAKNFVATFNTTNSTSYRLEIHIATTNATAYTLNFDNVYIGPESISSGPAMSDWIAYTPTFNGLGTVASIDCRYRRVGDTIEIMGKFTAGTTTAAEARIGLPTNLLIDSSYTQTPFLVGYISRNTAIAAAFTLLGEPSVNYMTVGVLSGAVAGLTKQNGSAVFGTGEVVSFFGKAKISGWSSNVISANSRVFRISSYLANGTRVTGTAPVNLGEYRSYRRNAGASTYTETSAAPTTTPSSANGVLIYKTNGYATGDSVNSPSKYDIFVGKNKNIDVQYYSATGQSGFVNINPFIQGSGLYAVGMLDAYDPTTGIFTVYSNAGGSGITTSYSGYDSNGGLLSTNIYFDIVVSDNPLPVQASSPFDRIPYIKLSDEKSGTTAGGTSTSGINTRTLNTKNHDTASICTLSSNQFTLPAGTYRINASAPCYAGDRHGIALRNVTDSTYTLQGQSCLASSTGAFNQTDALMRGEFTITSTKTFELRHQINTAQTTFGLGVDNGISTFGNQVYAVVELWKVA